MAKAASNRDDVNSTDQVVVLILPKNDVKWLFKRQFGIYVIYSFKESVFLLTVTVNCISVHLLWSCIQVAAGKHVQF